MRREIRTLLLHGLQGLQGENSKAYRVYDFSIQEIAVSRDVIFLKEGQVTPREGDPIQEVPFEIVVKNEMEVAEEQV